MNAALKGMAAADKKEYALDSKDRRYEREKDKREAQDRKDFNKKVYTTLDEQSKDLGKQEEGKKLAAGMASATAAAIADTVKKNKDKSKAEEPKGTGGPAGISMSRAEMSQTPSRTEVITPVPKDDHEERLAELEATVFNFNPGPKVQKLQSGGFAGAVPNLGQPTEGDHFYTHVQPGSYVLNRNAVAAMGFQGGGNVPVALEQGEVVIPPGQYDQKMMDFINYAAAPRFQSGGEVPKDNKKDNGAPTEDRLSQSLLINPELSTTKVQKKQQGGKIFLHWTASPYGANFPQYYHTVFDGEGKAKRNQSYDKFRTPEGHTWNRNGQGVALSLASMAGPKSDPWQKDPPTDAQFKGMALEIAAIGKKWGWGKTQITSDSVMTHAEAAKRDGYFGERWDLLQLRKGESDWSGGEKLRAMAKQAMDGELPNIPDAVDGQAPTSFPTGGGDEGGGGNSSAPANPFSSYGPLAKVFQAIDDKVFKSGDNAKYGVSLAMLLNPEQAFSNLSSIDDVLSGGGGGGERINDTPGSSGDDSPVEAAPLSGGVKEKAKMMYDYAKTLGLSSAQAKGLIANIHRESTFNPKAISGDDRGPGGLFQWKGVRQTPEVAKLVNSGDWKGQIRYALKEDVGPRYKGETAGMSAVDAAKWWMEKWERPADTAAGHRKHKSFIKSYNFQKGGMVKALSKVMGMDLTNFFEQSDIQLQRQASLDDEPSVINMADEDPSEPLSIAHSSGYNGPTYNLPTRDYCPLSVYYRYHPSLNPQGMNP